jgi:hypothetical protein
MSLLYAEKFSELRNNFGLIFEIIQIFGQRYEKIISEEIFLK